VSEIAKLYQIMRQQFHSNPRIERQVYQDISRFVSTAFTQSMQSDEGYCFKFSLPNTEVMKLYKTIGFEIKEVFDAYKKDWGAPAMTNQMHSDPYYQILLLITYYGILEKKEHLYNHAMMLCLMRIWNGRKVRYIKFCDKKIMKYVTTHMVTKKHNVAKYDTPISLLHDYYIPTLYKKYGPEIKRNPAKLQQLFQQMWSRINQLFVYNMRTSLSTGKKEAQGGILHLYMKAKKDGMSLSNPIIGMGDDNQPPGFDEYSTVHVRDEMTNDITDYITMNPNPTYPPSLIRYFNERFNVKEATIGAILKAMHNHQYQAILQDLVSVILSRTNVLEKVDVCKTNYSTVVKRNIISSKNNPDTKKIQKLCNILLKKIFDNDLKDDTGKPLTKVYEKYSDVYQIQIRNVLVYGIVHNIKKTICRGNFSS
jgi:hypothetical protein